MPTPVRRPMPPPVTNGAGTRPALSVTCRPQGGDIRDRSPQRSRYTDSNTRNAFLSSAVRARRTCLDCPASRTSARRRRWHDHQHGSFWRSTHIPCFGFIYGLSANGATPPLTLQTQIKVKQMRTGGSQTGCPNGGYVNDAYTARWNIEKAYYARAKQSGAHLEMILAGLWGADGVCNVPTWPGDNGNWTEYTTFINQVISDVKANGMTGADVRWDMWNEPNGGFWGRSQAQYLEMIRRGTLQIRAAIPGAVIEGPSCACRPTNSWFATYLDYVKANNAVPDILSWHDLPGDPATDAANANSMLAARGMHVSGFDVNEYGGFGADQQPGPSAWYSPPGAM